MAADWLHKFDTFLPEMLADGVRVLVYAGEEDLICNWLGNRRWVDTLPWAQQADWLDAPELQWTPVAASKPAGAVTAVGPLTFIKVYEAGHMVPMDQPVAALDMITRFTRAIPYADQTPKASQAAAA